MRRSAAAVALLVVALVRRRGALASGAHRSIADKLTIWVGWSAGKRAHDLQEASSAEYDKNASGCDDQRRRRHQRQQDRRGDPRRARRPTSSARSTPTTSATTAASGGWIDLEPLLKKDHIDPAIVPAGAAVLHAVQGQALRAAAARRRLRPLLQQGAVREGRDHAPAEDVLRADRRREEADHEQLERHASRSRASTRSSASTRTRPSAGSTPFGGKWIDAKGKSILGDDPAWAKWANWQKS